MTAATRCFFNDRAETWDEMNCTDIMKSGERLIRSLNIEAISKVLDVGCGTGFIIPWLLEAVGERGQVKAVDIVDKMLWIARGKCERPNVLYLQADISRTPFLHHSFDEIVCHNCFLHMAEKENAAHEMYRVLRPGGLITISHTDSRDATNLLHRGIGGEVGEDMLPDGTAMKGIFCGAGFRGVSIRDGDGGYLPQAHKPR
ncbi:MAG: class I SAM-dependent methyltransferase [Actinomycetota bacterium]|nr:class I SAM-dependent methyltransferase [Actinomycetota bacterium]